MYWYKLLTNAGKVLISSLALCFAACKPDIKETGAALKYFDIKGYFSADTARLNRKDLRVLKTVTHNGVTESKKVTIGNWGQELDLFISSDINKPAWKNSYTITANSDFLIYRAKDPDLKMHEMVIRRDKQQVKWIMIINQTKNKLYQTNEKLSYFPDSVYIIQKLQKVRFIGTNSYTIKGEISK